MDIMFDDKSALEDFGLRLSKFTIEAPKPKRVTVSVPNRNGDLDLTYALSDEIYYENRNIEIIFYIVDLNKRWDANYEAVLNYIHGQRRNVVFGESTWNWDCFCEVTSVDTRHQVGVVTVNCVAHPYKKREKQVSKTIMDSGTITIENNRMQSVPEITSTSACSIAFEDKSVAIPAGTSIATDIVLKEGTNTLTVTGTTNITIKYTEGAL